MQPHSPTTRPGFTLVELLMVIIIIGILAGLLIVAVGPAIGTANTAVVKTEINQLDVALNNYRDTYGSLPPTMLPVGSALTPGTTEKRFERHVRKAFPRFRSDWGNIRTAIVTATEFPASATYAVSACDIRTMDAAEALVFWLGGIPKIWKADTSTGEFEVELTGFSSDPGNPFLPEYDPPSGGGTSGVDFQSERTSTLFEFDPQRLTDADEDGWPEYVPELGGTNRETPPIVYFDASSYGDLPFYPPMGHPGIASAAENWGLAHPYLIRYTPDPSDTEEMPLASNYANQETFQLLCSGPDLKFGKLTGSGFGPVQAAFDQMTVVPRGDYYLRKSGDWTDDADWSSIDAEEFDNLTNFLKSKLENDFNSGN